MSKLFTLILGIYILNSPTALAAVLNNRPLQQLDSSLVSEKMSCSSLKMSNDVSKRYDNHHSVSSNSHLAKYDMDGRNPPPNPPKEGGSR